MISEAEYQRVVTEVIGSLLTGEAQFLGRKVALAWPDGPPHAWSPDALQSLGRKWVQDARNSRNHWVEVAKAAADADRHQAVMEALALSTWFAIERGEDGEPARLVPIRGQVDFDAKTGAYVVTDGSSGWGGLR